MSTKIYNGYFLPSMSSFELNKWIQSLRKKLLKTASMLVKQQMADDCWELFDEISIGSCNEAQYKGRYDDVRFFRENEKIIYNIRHHILDSHEKIYKTNQRNPTYDFGFSLGIMPQKKKILITAYHEQTEYGKVLSKMKKIKDFSYWNNTDRPNDISKKEWSDREREWRNAFNNWRDSPAQVGMSWDLFPNVFNLQQLIPLVDEFDYASLIPSFEFRLEKWSKRKVIDVHFERLKQSPIYDPDEAISTYMKAMDYIKTDDGKAEIEEMKKTVEPMLKREITNDDLKKSFQQILNR